MSYDCTDCERTFDTEKGMKVHHSHRHKDRKVKECRVCGEKFSDYPSRIEGREFCSPECKDSHSTGENHPNWVEKIELICQQCGEAEMLPPCRGSRYEDWFCSQECYGAYRSDHYGGEDNPNWEGGYSNYYGPNWEKRKRQVRNRDTVCQVCDHDGSQYRLHVHHIEPFRNFEKSEIANRMSNLVLLCSPCHQRVESGNVECPKPTVEA